MSFSLFQRSTQSAERALEFPSTSPRNLSIVCNKYADDAITSEAQMNRSPKPNVRLGRVRAPEQFVSFTFPTVLYMRTRYAVCNILITPMFSCFTKIVPKF
jgi:hypothetical protein